MNSQDVILQDNKIYCQMSDIHTNQQYSAIMTLLSLDDKQQRIRYKQHTEEGKNEDNHSLKHHVGQYIRQNLSSRREVFPKLQSSKEQLKRNLKRLESLQMVIKEDRHYKVLQPFKLNQNVLIEDTTSKTTRVLKDKQYKESKVRKIKNEMKNDKSLLELSNQNEIRNIMKQKNYSANALNLKTMHILQEIQQRGYRCSSTLGKHQLNDLNKLKKTNMVAFLKRVA